MGRQPNPGIMILAGTGILLHQCERKMRGWVAGMASCCGIGRQPKRQADGP